MSTLKAKVNGGAPQSGHVVVAAGDTVQLTASGMGSWDGSDPARWEIYDYLEGWALPAGWTDDGDGIYYYLGNSEPPTFTPAAGSHYVTNLYWTEGGTRKSDETTGVDCPTTDGFSNLTAREGSRFGDARQTWVKPLKAILGDVAESSLGTPTAYSSAPIVISGNQRINYTGPSAAVITRAAAGHKPGGRVLIEFAAGSAASLRVSPDLNVQNCAIDALTFQVTDWNPAIPNELLLEHGINYSIGSLIKCAVPDATPPTVVSAAADSTNLDAVRVTFSEPVSVRALTGLSLSFSVGTARTITAIESGDGTTTVTFTLSGNLSATDVFSFVVGSTRVGTDYSGNLIATSTTAVSWGLVAKAAWTRCFEAGVAMLPASGLPANFTSWTDQVGGVLQFTQAGAGHASRTADPAVKFTNDATQRLHCNTSPVSGTDFALFGRYKFTSVAAQDWIPFCYDTDGASSKWLQIICTDNATSVTVQLSIYDGTTEHTVADSYSSDTAYHSVFIWRTGGTIYMQIDSRSPVSVSDSLTVTSLSNVSIGNLVYAGPTSYKPGNGSVSDLALKAGAAFVGTEKADIIAYIAAR